MLEDVVIANRSYAVLNVDESRKLDETAIKVLKQDCPDFLLPFKTIYIDGNMEIRFELIEGIRMSYQSQKMYKREFVQQMINMLFPFKNCNDWLLDYHYIYLNPQYIFINEKEQRVRYVYLPVYDCRQTDEEIKAFFSKFVINVELIDDKSFPLVLLRLLQDGHSSLLNVLEFLQNERGRQPVAAREENRPADRPQSAVSEKKIPSQSFLKSIVQEEKKEEKQKEEKPSEEFGKNNIEGDLLNNLYGLENTGKEKGQRKSKKDKKDKKGLLGGLFKGKKDKTSGDEEEQISHAPDIVCAEPKDIDKIPEGDVNAPGDYIGDDEPPTEMDVTEYSEGNSRFILRLHLESAGNYAVPSDIELNLEKGYITVGRYDKCGNKCADFNFDYSLTFISRNHFRIELCDEGYRIIDLASLNGTFLNGQELQPNIPYSLKSGDTIALSKKTRLTYRVL